MDAAAMDAVPPDMRPVPGGKCGPGGTAAFPNDQFRQPELQCKWKWERDVRSTPLVIDIDGDAIAEVVFPAFDGKIHAISGVDCTDKWSAAIEGYADSTWRYALELAAADLDGDGSPEIVHGRRFTVAVYDVKRNKQAYSEPGGIVGGAAEPLAIANVDGVPGPEILMGNAAFRYNGEKVITLWKAPVQEGAHSGAFNLAPADMDGDGVMEIVQNGRVLSGLDGHVLIEALPSEGFAAIVDWDTASSGPEIVLVDPTFDPDRNVVVVSGTGAVEPGKILFGPFSTGRPGEEDPGGGPPAIADFDGDGQPEIGIAARARYTVFDAQCAQNPLPRECEAPGIRWSMAIQEDSNITTSTAFDFNCDNGVEVVYRDTCWLRIFEGKTGKVLFSFPVTSGTALDGPVVADTDGDGHANVVLSSEWRGVDDCTDDTHSGSPFTGKTHGIMILRDPENRWAPTRPVWNQNAYHITNVEDDGTVADVEKPSWMGHNSYRANPVVWGK